MTHPIRRILLLFTGLSVMAAGVAFSITANLGTSPISSVPYVTSLICNVSTGMTTIVMNTFFIILQIIILRKDFRLFQLLQFPATIVFGTMIDVFSAALASVSYSGYLSQCLLCLAGIILVAAGVSLEVAAGLVTVPGEGIVLTLSRTLKIRFGDMKTIFDVTLVAVSVILSILFLSRLDGIREGTLAAALLVGQFVRIFRKGTEKITTAILQ